MVTMSAVWDRTSEFLSDNLAAVAAIAAVTLYLPGAVNEILQPAMATAGPGAKLGLSAISLALSLVGVFGQAALIALALDPALGRDGAFSRGLARVPALLGVSIVLLVAICLLLVPPLILAAASGMDLTAVSAQTAPNLGPGAALGIAVYVLVLGVLLLWAGARLAILASVVVGERLGLRAIGRAFRLTRGLAGRIVGVLILFGVIALVAVLAAKLVFGSLFRLAFGNEGTLNAASVLTALVVGLVGTVLTVAYTAFAAKLYVAVRDRDRASTTA